MRHVAVDLRQLDPCVAALRDVDVVLNLAGKIHGVGYSNSHHGEMLFENAVMSLNVLEAARLNGVERALVVSSCCVYADDSEEPVSELPAMEGGPEAANEGYGWAKRIAEKQAEYYSREFGMPIAICRPVNAYGGRYVWRGEERSQAFPTLVRKVLDRRDPVVVWGSGRQRRNYLHGSDVARLLLLVTERHACAEPVNVGYEDDISVVELVERIQFVSGIPGRIEFDALRPEGRQRKRVDSTLLRKITDDYTPRVSLDDGIRDMIEWYERTFSR